MSKKILIMEDEKILADLLEKKLKESGYEILVASDGVSGMELLKTMKPDLVLLDIIMPAKGGFEVMEEMNVSEEFNLKKIPVIIVSNSGQPVEIDKALALGVRDYLIKTKFDPQEVLDKVKEQLEAPQE
jgi:CheY-like chemotaxis protein